MRSLFLLAKLPPPAEQSLEWWEAPVIIIGSIIFAVAFRALRRWMRF